MARGTVMKCPFGCSTVGYVEISRLMGHLVTRHVPHDVSHDTMASARNWLQSNHFGSKASKWRGIYGLVRPAELIIPTPYIHTGDQYRTAILTRTSQVLASLKESITRNQLVLPCPDLVGKTDEEKDAILIHYFLAMDAIIKHFDEEGI